MKKINPLIVFALKEESQGMFDDYTVLYTGVGKVNAADFMSETLCNNRPDVVINLGTAGSHVHRGGAIVNGTAFIQRDMDVTALGCKPYQTPFSKEDITLKHALTIPGYPQSVIGTGDNFAVSTDPLIPYDTVDMEAYALASVCKRRNIPFVCLKYISDGADDSASEDWTHALRTAGGNLRNALENTVSLLPGLI